jgi:hypothetical protein
MDQRETHAATQATTWCLRRVAVNEDLLKLVRRYTGTRVNDREVHLVVCFLEPHDHLSRAVSVLVCGHGVDGIVDKISQNR